MKEFWWKRPFWKSVSRLTLQNSLSGALKYDLAPASVTVQLKKGLVSFDPVSIAAMTSEHLILSSLSVRARSG